MINSSNDPVIFTEDIRQTFALRDLWDAAMNLNGSIALWRCPRERQIHFLVDLSQSPRKGRVNLQETEPGFVVSSFLNSDGSDILFLNADIYVVFGSSNGPEVRRSHKDKRFWQIVNSEGKKAGKIPYHLNIRPDTEISGKQEHFLEMVEDGIQAIRNGEFDKVVTARTYDEPLPDQFDVVSQFERLERAYPEAFVNLISVPGNGTWMGATPELLLESSECHFRTVSLAGTQPFPLDAELSEATWNQKEIEEQAMVSRYIIEQFKTIRLREFIETGPKTVRAGNMIHLKTEYTVDLTEIDMPELSTVMMNLLHPTSAVCGMPKQPALDFIIEYEYLNREFYSGYLGPVNIGGMTRLYVNLRCMQILRTRAVLYAGAGITHYSIPKKEWEETALKCQTLLNVMNGSHSD